MDTLETKQKLYEYIDVADDEKVAALYDSIKVETAVRYEWWDDDKMVAELRQLSADLKSGKEQGSSWEEVKERLLSRRR